MIKIELTYREAEALHKVLHEHLSEIALEIGANGIEDFTELLKQEEGSIQTILDYLQKQGIGSRSEIFGGYSE